MYKRLTSRLLLPRTTALAVVSGCLLAATGAPALAAGTALAASTAPAAGAPDLASQWWLTALGVPQAWQSVGSTANAGAGVTVAVLSTGVDPSHPDLTGTITTGPDYSNSGARPGDPYWGPEGTAVASLIAGHGHGTGAGITGVAPSASILSLRVTLEYNDPRNSQASITRALPGAIAAGIRYAVAHGASVIALPLDPGTLGPLMTGDPTAAGGSGAERAAVEAALAANVVLVAPAGDNGASTQMVNYPAAYPGVLAAGATDRNGHLEPFSATKSYVALTAPGAGLTVATPGGGYRSLTTTDMSAALTAGVAALIRARYPRLSAAQVTSAIEHGTTPRAAGSPAAGTGAGALSATQAMRAAAAIDAKLPAPAPTASKSPAATARPHAGAASATRARRSALGLGGTTRSVLRDAAIGAGALIMALIAVLLLARSRRRKARAARLGRDPAPPGRAESGGFPALRGSQGMHAAPRRASATGSQPALGDNIRGTGSQPAVSGHGADRTTGSHATVPRTVPGTVLAGAPSPTVVVTTGRAADTSGRPRPRPAQFPRTGSLGPMSRPPRPDRPGLPGESAPWAPARMPSLPPEPEPAFPPAQEEPEPLPPWERPSAPKPATGSVFTDSLTAPTPVESPVPAELPRRDATPAEPPQLPQEDDPPRRNTGPMYVWNPATNSGPFPTMTTED